MTYRIAGLDPAPFRPLFTMDEAALAANRASLQRANTSWGFPCRVSLRDADEGDELVLVHHVNHEVETPYRNAFAVFVRRAASEPAVFVDECPPVFEGRPLALRGYTETGNLHTARLVTPGAADETIRAMLTDTAIAYIDAHNAAYGCFAARVERHD